MSFEDKPTDELIRIARAGLGFALVQNSKPQEEIEEILDAAAEGGAIVTLVCENDHLHGDDTSRYK